MSLLCSEACSAFPFSQRKTQSSPECVRLIYLVLIIFLSNFLLLPLAHSTPHRPPCYSLKMSGTHTLQGFEVAVLPVQNILIHTFAWLIPSILLCPCSKVTLSIRATTPFKITLFLKIPNPSYLVLFYLHPPQYLLLSKLLYNLHVYYYLLSSSPNQNCS